MRADRLVAALVLMRARGRITAAELAAELQISLATARRDLEALAASGVPVSPQPGRGGGWSIVGDTRHGLSALTTAEAHALFTLVRPAAHDPADTHTPPGDWSPDDRRSPTCVGTAELGSALRKLLRTLPQPAPSVADVTTVPADDGPVTRVGEHEPIPKRPSLTAVLRRAIMHRRKIRIVYHSRDGDYTIRLVDPLGLVERDDAWYLLAGTVRGRRAYRVDLIERAEVTDRRRDRSTPGRRTTVARRAAVTRPRTVTGSMTSTAGATSPQPFSSPNGSCHSCASSSVAGARCWPPVPTAVLTSG